MTIATTRGDLTSRWLRRLRPADNPWVRLVCFPHAGGNAYSFTSWARAFPADVDLYAVQYPGRLDRLAEPLIEDPAELADAVAAAIQPLTDAPVALFGHSLGAVIGYEVARRLAPVGTAVGSVPARLFVSGRPAPDRQRPGDLHLADDEQLWEEVRRLGGANPEVLANPELRDLFLPVLRGDYQLDETYTPQPWPPLRCPISALLGAEDTEVSPEEARSWAGYTAGGFTLRVFPGDHFYLSPPAPGLVDELVNRLTDSVPGRQPVSSGP